MSIDQVPGARADAIGEISFTDGHSNAGIPQSESGKRPPEISAHHRGI